MPTQKRSVPSGREEDQSPTAAEDQLSTTTAEDQPSTTAEDEPSTPAEGEGAVWAARRADLELRSRLSQVTVTHRLQAVTALTEYERTVLEITQEAAERESGALSSMESGSRRQEASIEDRLASAQEVQERLLSGRQSSDAALRGAARRLAEELQRAWLEALDGYQEAHAQYERALQATLVTSVIPGAGPWTGGAESQFAVAADEGLALVWPNGVAWPEPWSSGSWNAVRRW